VCHAIVVASQPPGKGAGCKVQENTGIRGMNSFSILHSNPPPVENFFLFFSCGIIFFHIFGADIYFRYFIIVL
jgi:hypothetical protein